MKMNRFLSVILTLVILLGAFTLSIASEQRIKVLLNGAELPFDVPPLLINDRTMVPMREYLRRLGHLVFYTWVWDPAKLESTRTNIMINGIPANSLESIEAKYTAIENTYYKIQY